MSAPKKPPRVANRYARAYVQQRKPFRGNNTFGTYIDGRYVVYSFGAHWPMFVYDDGRWFANSSLYGQTTSKHRSQLHPLTDCTLLPLDGIHDIVAYGFLGTLTRRLVGDEAYAKRQENDVFEDVTEAVTA
jgi:hypothetical protein